MAAELKAKCCRHLLTEESLSGEVGRGRVLVTPDVILSERHVEQRLFDGCQLLADGERSIHIN